MFLFFLIITLASKCNFPDTETITILAAFVSFCELGSWALLTFILTVDYTLEQSIIDIGMYLGIAVLLLSISLGVIFNILFCHQYECDRGLQAWKEHDDVCVRSYRIVTGFSCLTFRFFRLIYSKLF